MALSRPSPRSRTRSERSIAEQVQAAVPFVGLTGGMGSGKSTALEALRRLGAEVLSSDAVVHELYEGSHLRDAVVARFGAEVAPGGIVDRAAVAERAFASAQERAWLEGQVWPMVGARVQEWLEHARAMHPAPRAAVVEVPLLFEAGLDELYDATIAVVAEESVRRGRADARGHALVDERVARQLPQEEKACRATFVVHNDGSREDLERELSAVLGKLGR
ncbi:MAG TPA: dephospho-CoA kinase [Solirubrobacteraceae bacterium]|jgi:dephospho-CoA kinase|nr:dephospho-CoA kinase [Solirubrobacteraceae bacterium]